jgi:hypothetical protein
MPQVQVLPSTPDFGSQLAQILAQAGVDIGQGLMRRNDQKALNNLLNPSQSQKSTGGPPSTGSPSSTAQNQPEGINPQKIGSLYNAAEKVGGTQYANAITKAETEKQKLASKEASQGRREEAEAYKATADYRNEILDNYKSYKGTVNRLDRLEQLNTKGNLTEPALAGALEAFGIPLGVLNNPDSEEFQKLSQDLLSGLTKTLGSRLNIAIVENFLKTIPTLKNSKEGREKIISNYKKLLEPQKLEYEAYKKIREKGGKIPYDLRERVTEELEPELERLANEFTKDFGAPIPKQNPRGDFVTILDPQGIPRSVPRDQANAAIQAGGKLQ